MSGHRLPDDLYASSTNSHLRIDDPGDGNAIIITKNLAIVNLISSTGAETRTLAAPVSEGLLIGFCLESITSGTLAITVAGGFDQAGSTVLTFATAGDYIMLQSVEVAPATYVWRVAAPPDGVTGPTLALGAISLDTLVVSTTAQVSTLTVPGDATIAALEVTGSVIEPLTLEKGIDRSVYTEIFEDFIGDVGGTLPTPWVTNLETSVTGDYMANESLGAFAITTTAANQADAGQITWGDNLMIDLGKNPTIEFRVRVDGIATLESVEKIVFGVCPVHTNAETDLDSIADSAWFMLKGDNDLKIYVEADDAVVDTDDQDSTKLIVDDTWITLKIDFADMSDVVFTIDGVEQGGATVDMTDSADVLVQPIVCFTRSDNSQTEAVIGIEIDYIHIVQER